MARKKMTYVVREDNRDKGKQFLITEMSATQAEDWAISAMMALGAANVELPEDAGTIGMAALAEIGLKRLFSVNKEQLKPLLHDLMRCVEFVPDPMKPNITLAYPLFEAQVEEAKTLFILKWETLKLHLDFFQDAGPSSVEGGHPASKEKRQPSMRMSRA